MAEWNARVEHLRSLYIQSRPNKDMPLTSEQQQLHDQLKQMINEREAILTQQMNSLDNELSTTDRAALRDFLTKQIASRVVTSNIFIPVVIFRRKQPSGKCCHRRRQVIIVDRWIYM